MFFLSEDTTVFPTVKPTPPSAENERPEEVKKMAHIAMSSSYKQLGTDYAWTTVAGRPSQGKGPIPILPKTTLSLPILSTERPGCALSGGQPCATPRQDPFPRQSDLLLSALASPPVEQKLHAFSQAACLSAFSSAPDNRTIPPPQQQSWQEEIASSSTRGKPTVSDPARPNHHQNGETIIKEEPFGLIQALEGDETASESQAHRVQTVQHAQPVQLVQPVQKQSYQLQAVDYDRLPSWLDSGLPQPTTADNATAVASSKHHWRHTKSAVQKKVDHANRERTRVRERRRLLNELTDLVPELQLVSRSKIPGERKHGLSTVEVLRASCAYIRSIHNSAHIAVAATAEESGEVPKGAAVVASTLPSDCDDDGWNDTESSCVATAASAVDPGATTAVDGVTEACGNDSGFTGSPPELLYLSQDATPLAELQQSPEADASPLVCYMDVHAADGSSGSPVNEGWLEQYRNEWDTVTLASSHMPIPLAGSPDLEEEFQLLLHDDVPISACPVPGVVVVDGQVSPQFDHTMAMASSDAAAGHDQDESPGSPSFNYGQMEWYDQSDIGPRDIHGMLQLADLEDVVRCECPDECHT